MEDHPLTWDEVHQIAIKEAVSFTLEDGETYLSQLHLVKPIALALFIYESGLVLEWGVL